MPSSTDILTAIARNTIVGFLLSLGLIPSEGEDTLEVRDFGPHRVFTQQARVPDTAISIDPGDVLTQLADYIGQYNTLPTAVKFQAYNVEAYCGTFVYVSISHTA